MGFTLRPDRKDFNFLEKQASIKLIDVLDVYNTEFNIQCNEN